MRSADMDNDTLFFKIAIADPCRNENLTLAEAIEFPLFSLETYSVLTPYLTLVIFLPSLNSVCLILRLPCTV